jgi:splicing factor 3A subunit 1
MDDHVRIELLDPKWREQKLAAELKKKESNLLQEGLYRFYTVFY